MIARAWCAGLALLAGAAVAQVPTEASTVPLTPEQEAQYRDLLHELRCLVCQNQTIADSDAPLAMDLRNQVRAHVAAGKSDEDVRRYLTARYGEFVLYKPRLNAQTLVLWVGPFAVLAFALLVAVRFVRRHRATAVATPPPADPAQLKKLLDEERG
ncbi:MAG TPA: cytochrome c-type biogenesis protein [Nevskiaceae bacterium]|nr:cytochrome c-type biogenesis protein [Nevskiaceae bacterium]